MLSLAIIHKMHNIDRQNACKMAPAKCNLIMFSSKVQRHETH